MKNMNMTETNEEVVEPLGFQKEKAELVKSQKEAFKLAMELRHKSEQEKRRCKHPNHSTYYVNKHGKCRKAWKCPDHGSQGCVATATRS